ncbi:hypothetical protein HK099_000265 [Clydaea vesicula]|uniref:Phospholipid/glycerol acyltransferase domain-containing protein n=1 Tax=Clydaea vesicula TaxID=447962 RepID=A0AAD5TV59_9FUNG|nr:hypothetical protein HK099_000265 [Clydaea vesicula]
MDFYDLIRLLFRWVLHIFFREIYCRGQHNIPANGPVIFVVAPHANQFVDPMMLITNTKRHVSFLSAQKSMDRKYVGFFARKLKAIGVVRGQDLTFKGTGKIKLSSSSVSKNYLIGVNNSTKFLSEVKVKSVIAFQINSFKFQKTVSEIIDDQYLKFKENLSEEELAAISNYSEDLLNSGVDYKITPFVDQGDMFTNVIEQLKKGGSVGIFPEGGSHDRTEFLPLKAGVAIVSTKCGSHMALGAMAANPGLDVKIVPVGLSYFHPNKFRSRAVIEFGEAISISTNSVENYLKGGLDKRESCSKLLDVIHHSLKSVTVTAPDYDTLMVIQAARRLYQVNSEKKLSLASVAKLTRKFVKGYVEYQHEPKVIELTKRVREYNAMLKSYGIRDHQVKNTSIGRGTAFVRLLLRLLAGLFLSLILLPGAILNFPIILITSIISKRKAKEALAASSVKLKGRDVIATWKVLVASVVVPLTYAIESLLITMFIYFFSTHEFTSYPHLNNPVVQFLLIFLVILPSITYPSVFGMEKGVDLFKSLKPLILAIFLDQKYIDRLRSIRSKLEVDLKMLINEFGPSAIGEEVWEKELTVKVSQPKSYPLKEEVKKTPTTVEEKNENSDTDDEDNYSWARRYDSDDYISGDEDEG